ncbi:MAG: type II toxin-antitoxin system PemK/MazF family toxin [Mariprofundus sp.]
MVEVIKRGEVWVANLNPNRGGEIGKARPVVILQEDRITATGLRTVLVAPLTTQFRPAFAPLRVHIKPRNRLLRDCYVMVEHVTALDRARFGDGPLAILAAKEMVAVEKNLKAVFALLD